MERSIDLMQYHRDAPRSVMEELFAHMMQWGKEHAYRRFALGMAPLSGSPGGLRLPRIMADVSALVAGGYRRIFRK